MTWYRCTACQPSATPRPGIVYFPEWQRRCDRCGGDLTFVAIKGVRSADQEALATKRTADASLKSSRKRARDDASDAEPDDADDDGDAEAVLASKAEVEPARKRLATGIEGLDRVLGGGFPRGITYLVRGPHGGGKSRLLRLAAVAMCRHGNVVLAVSGKEEHGADVLRRLHSSSHNGVPYMSMPHVAKRLHVVTDADNVDRIARIVVEKRAVYAVVDSAPTVKTNNAPRVQHRQQAYAVELLRSVARETDAIVAALAHEDVDGRLKGGTGNAYEADVLMTVKMMRRLKGGRVISLGEHEREDKFAGLIRLGNEKNRFCPPGPDRLALFQMDDAGIIEAPPGAADEDEETDRDEPAKSTVPRQPHRAQVSRVGAKGPRAKTPPVRRRA